MSDDTLSKTLEDLRSMKPQALRIYLDKVQKKYRRHNKLEEALREYYKLQQVFEEMIGKEEGGVEYTDLSISEYEIGHTNFLINNIDESVIYFRKSALNSKNGGDRIGEVIAKYWSIRAQFLSKRISAEEAKAPMQEALYNFTVLKEEYDHTGNDAKAQKCDNWVYNIPCHLFDLAIDMENIEDAEFYFKKFCEHHTTRDLLSKEPPEPGRLIDKLSREARLFLLQKNYQDALNNIAAFINLSSIGLFPPENSLFEKASSTPGVARNYLIAGNALRALGRVEDSKMIFEIGLQLPPDNANHIFQDEIQKVMHM